MCIASILGLKPPKPPEPPQLPPIQKKAPEQPKNLVKPQSLTEKDDKPKVDFAKKMSTSKAKRVGASDLKIPLQQTAAGGSTGGLNV
tara:strand:+ start:100 stop:360 length:261 start_codon:yes stop_codon:yes gene_type:complete